jgi:hypothetical protein
MHLGLSPASRAHYSPFFDLADHAVILHQNSALKSPRTAPIWFLHRELLGNTRQP